MKKLIPVILIAFCSCNRAMLMQQRGEVADGKIKGVGPVQPFNPRNSFLHS